jgi:hypothetical protein
MIFLFTPNFGCERVIVAFAKIQGNLLPGAIAVTFPHKGGCSWKDNPTLRAKEASIAQTF